jgi:hypothetical protein
MLTTLYPEFPWLLWRFGKCPQNFWDKKSNQFQFLEWAAQQLNIKQPSDWYNVTNKDLSEIGGASLLNKYNKSPSSMLSAVYPEYNWLPWKFKMCPLNFWEDVNNQKKFIEWAAQELNIKEISDWQSVSRKVTSSFFVL